MTTIDVEAAVRDRYTGASNACEAELCCPVEYSAELLAPIPAEVIERDYGCGDPSRYAQPGDTVLDLGSGGGKICFMASQVVGADGEVIGVDMNEEMLDLARRSAPAVAANIGWDNVSFFRGRIQDLRLDLDTLDSWLKTHPVHSATELSALQAEQSRLRSEHPMIADDSVDLVVSNCVLNLVRDEDKTQLIEEVYRVLKPGGRIAISDIVSDEAIPAELKADPKLWSGCISGAFEERGFLAALEEAGFVGIEISEWSDEPWQVVEGIEFRPVVLTAKKPLSGRTLDGNQAIIYRGPWAEVKDDQGRVLKRGERVAVSTKTFEMLTSAPFSAQIIGIEPSVVIPEDALKSWDCCRPKRREPAESKAGGQAGQTTRSSSPDSCC
jgi:ubiquinone/menaquinone biosynthesis C-methylase UbiE